MHILYVVKSTSYNSHVDIELGMSVAVVKVAFTGVVCVRNTR